MEEGSRPGCLASPAGMSLDPAGALQQQCKVPVSWQAAAPIALTCSTLLFCCLSNAADVELGGPGLGPAQLAAGLLRLGWLLHQLPPSTCKLQLTSGCVTYKLKGLYVTNTRWSNTMAE